MDESKTIIMVVDDQPDFVEGVKLILEVEGYEVWTASNGRQALDRLEKAAGGENGETKPIFPDLILADIMMPIMDGYTLYEETQANLRLKNIPFIFLTAKTAISDLQHGKSLGVEDYLTKPCVPDVLLASVRGQLKEGEPSPVVMDNHNLDMPAFVPAPSQPVQVQPASDVGTGKLVLIVLAVFAVIIAFIIALNTSVALN